MVVSTEGFDRDEFLRGANKYFEEKKAAIRDARLQVVGIWVFASLAFGGMVWVLSDKKPDSGVSN